MIKHEIKKAESVLILTPNEAALDDETAWPFRDQAVNLFRLHKARNLVLDLHKLTTITGPGVGGLLSILRSVHLQGGEMKLCGVSKAVRQILRLVSAHKIFEVFNDSKEAVGSFSQNR